jgi:hypothetical protein
VCTENLIQHAEAESGNIGDAGRQARAVR